MTGRLDGKVAIITGASTGLGPVLGSRFVREGARVLLAARREKLVREAANAADPGAVAMRADVTDEHDVAAMVARAVDEFGHVDILCNNAAAPGEDRWIWEQTLCNWNATIAIDVTAAMLCTREVLNRSMLQRRSGVILNFSSTASYSGMVRKAHYVTAKAALRAFTKTVALEAGAHGIRCNSIVPGAIDTQLWRNWVQRTPDEQGVDFATQRAKSLKGVALQDISSPDDVANLAVFLASDEGRALCENGRFPVTRPSLQVAGLRLLQWHAAPHALISAEVVPFRPHRGVVLIVEEADRGRPERVAAVAARRALSGFAGHTGHPRARGRSARAPDGITYRTDGEPSTSTSASYTSTTTR
ncbi:MAG TPA: SDR family NAD(P)-dependent oxidoreductase [Mycobacterium sp.]|nr:SDR family NAD(P)-dependent oxidoreductase [Mycobacterium sp.]HTX97576.1 SDR family NAD(P)-dependent oxidoreductase [Mycobacterium sp.]